MDVFYPFVQFLHSISLGFWSSQPASLPQTETHSLHTAAGISSSSLAGLGENIFKALQGYKMPAEAAAQ